MKEGVIKWQPDIGYLTDLYTKLNEANLQDDELNLIKTKPMMLRFSLKLC